MKLSRPCLERASDMMGVNWPRVAPREPDANGSYSDGSYDPTFPIQMHMTQTNEPKGFQYNNVTYRAVCGTSATAVPANLDNSTSPAAIVVNVTAMTNTNPERPFTMHLSSCDGAMTYNTTKPGLFVIKGSAAAVFLERTYGTADKWTDKCPGEVFVAFTSATIDDYCKVDATLPECKTAVPSTKSSATSVKRSGSLVAILGVIATTAATFPSA